MRIFSRLNKFIKLSVNKLAFVKSALLYILAARDNNSFKAFGDIFFGSVIADLAVPFRTENKTEILRIRIFLVVTDKRNRDAFKARASIERRFAYFRYTGRHDNTLEA